MLEATSPADKRGFCQGKYLIVERNLNFGVHSQSSSLICLTLSFGCSGVNITVMNFGAAVSPFLLGAIADMAGTPVAIWICIGISFLAAFMNMPLLWVTGCNVPPKSRPAEAKPLRGEDKEMVEKALRGEWIPAQALEEINAQRYRDGQPYLIIHPRSYEDEKHELAVLRKRAKKDFFFHQQKTREYLHQVSDECGC